MSASRSVSERSEDLPVKSCPRCGTAPKRGPTTLEFVHAPAATRAQLVEGWVCPKCGERYIEGEVARAAHARAFQKS